MNLRALALAVVALVSLSALATAQSGPEPGGDRPTSSTTTSSTTTSPTTTSTSTTTKPPVPSCQPGNPCNDPAFRDCMAHAGSDEARRACVDDYCSKHDEPSRRDWCARYCGEKTNAGREACRGYSTSAGPGNDDVPAGARPCLSAAQPGVCVKDYCVKHGDDCRAFCREHPAARLCTFKPEGDERHISYEPMADGQGFTRLTVNGVLVLESVRMDVPGGAEFKAARTEHALTVTAGKNTMELHDEEGGFLRFEGPDATVTLVLPDGATHQLGPMGKRATIEYPGRGGAVLESSNMTWDGRTVVVSRFFSFHANMGKGDGPVGEKVKDALKRGDKVGAEVRVDGDDRSEVLAYGQVKVALRPPRDAPTPDDPLRVTLSSELPEGRTIVLHINKTVLDVEAGRVKLRYFDLPDGENGTARTEVVFRPATDLDDILNPDDDNGQPEYYVVRDQNGLQVLVSVPHWSAHMVELSGLADVLTPSVVVGVAAGLGVVAVAAVALFVPRRRQD